MSDYNYSTLGRRAAICAIVVTVGLALIIALSIWRAQTAVATGDHHGPKDCAYFPDAPGCVDPEPTCETDPSLCEPEPCPEGTVRDEAGECTPVVVTPPVEPPVVVPPVKPHDDGRAIPRDPPMPAIDQGKKRGETTTGCGWSRTVHPNGKVTWGDGIDCSDMKEEGF